MWGYVADVVASDEDELDSDALVVTVSVTLPVGVSVVPIDSVVGPEVVLKTSVVVGEIVVDITAVHDTGKVVGHDGSSG